MVGRFSSREIFYGCQVSFSLVRLTDVHMAGFFFLGRYFHNSLETGFSVYNRKTLILDEIYRYSNNL
jgi:hypothetical protein